MKTKEKVMHTATPWYVTEDEDGDRVIVDSMEGGLVIARRMNEFDAAFIVLAVNEFDSLKKA